MHGPDHDAPGQLHHDTGSHDVQHGAGDAWHDVLAFFGVGRVPFMVVWVTLFIFAGFTGLIVNRVVYLNLGLGEGGAAPVWMFPAWLVAALVVGFVGVRFFARAAARLVDVGGNGSTSKKQLVGRFGVVASGSLDARFGEVRVHDGKDEILVHGRLQDGEAALARGARVVLVDYDDASDLYWVTISPDVDAAG